AAVEPRAQDHHLCDARHRRGDSARRPHPGAVAAVGAHRRRARDHDPALARRARHHDSSGFRRALSAHQGAGAMSAQGGTIEARADAAPWSGRRAVVLGRLALAALLLLAWKLGATVAGPVYVADPIAVAQRIVADTLLGELICHTLATLRLSGLGF